MNNIPNDQKSNNAQDGNYQKPQKNKSNWLMWVLLIFVPLIGIIYIWLAKKELSTNKKLVLSVIAAIWFIIIIGMNKNANINKSSKNTVASTVTQSTTNTTTEKDNTSTDTKATEKATEATQKSTTASVPTEYKSALAKAKQYRQTMYMSKRGLYDQLTSDYGEKFSAEAAQYAIDNVNADWNQNALKKAQQYQSQMNMSPSAIYDQLSSDAGEKFTADEAQYAIQNLK